MDYEFRDGKLLSLARGRKANPPRLRRIEGQVRGLIQMLEADRYCLEEVQQANAVTSAMRDGALLILTSHLDAGVDFAVKSGRTDDVLKEVSSVLPAALKL